MLASTVQFSKNNQTLPTTLNAYPVNQAVRRLGKPCVFSLKETLACSLRTQQRTDQSTQPPDDLSTQASLQYSLIRQPDVKPASIH